MRTALALAFAGFLGASMATPAYAASGGGGGGGGGGGSGSGASGGGSSGGGSSGMPAGQVCKKGLVWNGVRCAKPRSSGLDDKQLLEQGRRLALAGYYDNALEVLDAVSNKHDAQVLTYIGYSHRKRGDVDVGIDYYHQALAIDPNNLNTREYLGEGYVSAGKMDEAKAQLAVIEKLCGGTECEQYEDLANAIAGKPDLDD